MTHVPPTILWFTVAKQDAAWLSHLNQFRISRFGHGQDRDIHDTQSAMGGISFSALKIGEQYYLEFMYVCMYLCVYVCVHVCVRSVLISSNLMMSWFSIWQALVPNILAKSGYSSGLNMHICTPCIYVHTYVCVGEHNTWKMGMHAGSYICTYVVQGTVCTYDRSWECKVLLAQLFDPQFA